MLQISRIKPNPRGKDRTRLGHASPEQLGAEWVDVRNAGGSVAELGGIQLCHRAYSDDGTSRMTVVTSLSGQLGSGRTIRVHAGQHRGEGVLRHEDQIGADRHVFTGTDQYVWNNEEGDTAALFDTGQERYVDEASYAPNPPEGIVLVRSGDRLVVPSGAGRY